MLCKRIDSSMQKPFHHLLVRESPCSTGTMRMVLLLAAAVAAGHSQTPSIQAPSNTAAARLKTRASGAPPIEMPGGDSHLTGVGPRLIAAAERFSQTAQQYICHESLRQRVIRPRSLKKEKGQAAMVLTGVPQYNQRLITSYYAFTTFGKSPEIHEIRMLLTVDKDTVNKDFEGRRIFRAALLTRDDRTKSQIAGQFEPEALNGVAMDLGQMILSFAEDSIANFDFNFDREENIGAAPAMVVRYKQNSGSEAIRINDRGKKLKSQLSGWLWLRQPDGVPLRITMISSRTDKKHEIRDEAEVDYAENPSGALLPPPSCIAALKTTSWLRKTIFVIPTGNL